MTRSSAVPCSVSTRASMPCSRASAAASSGCISTNGSETCAARRALRPVRVMVCHWSRTRPVFSTNGQASETAASICPLLMATKRARPLGVANLLSPNSRSEFALLRRTGHCTGTRRAYWASLSPARPDTSKSRSPSFSKPDRRACSRKMSAGDRYEKSSAHPSRAATCDRIHQSARVSPGDARKARWREMRRSELVTVPSFSPQAAAGSLTWARLAVSLLATFSDTTSSSSRPSASRT